MVIEQEPSPGRSASDSLLRGIDRSYPAQITETKVEGASKYSLVISDTEKYGTPSEPGIFASCFGENQYSPSVPLVIPFEDIIYATDEPGSVRVTYVDPSEREMKPLEVFVNLVGSNARDVILRAYKDPSSLKRRTLVLINPNGGQGEATQRFQKYIKPILDAVRLPYDVLETKYHRHCVDIIKNGDLDNYDMIACCSGDGLPHEVINGMFERKDRDQLFKRLIVTQLPCGSGNAFSLTCHKTLKASHATVLMLKSPVIALDLMGVNQGQDYKLSFLSQTYGVIADADILTEWMRFLGPSRFDLGVGAKVCAGTRYPCDLYVKYAVEGSSQVEEHVRLYQEDGEVLEHDFLSQLPSLDQEVPSEWKKVKNTNNLMVFYTGKMPYIAKDAQFFPAALPCDGAMDMVLMHVDLGFLTKAEILLSIGSGKHFFHQDIEYSKITAYRLVPYKKNYISVDGESFPLEPIQGEILKGVLRTVLGGFKATVLRK